MFIVHQILEREGVTLNVEMCQFFTIEVTFLGQLLEATGIQPDRDKIQAILNLPEPQHKEISRNGKSGQ